MPFLAPLIVALLPTASSALGQSPIAIEPLELKLWDEGAPGAPDVVPDEVVKDRPGGGDRHVRDVHVPTITVYLPVGGEAARPAVVICPGGGYGLLALDKEGHDVARWFAQSGVVGVVLKYRLPRPTGHVYGHQAPLSDARRALGLVREHAVDWRVDPKRVGLMGFSAGGHLAASASVQIEKGRPNFSVLVYPVISMQKGVTHGGSRTNLLGEEPSSDLVRRYSSELAVTRETPPAFLVHTSDDPVKAENSIGYYSALRAAGVPAELHLFARGGHGYGLRRPELPVGAWPDLLLLWMKDSGLIPGRDAAPMAERTEVMAEEPSGPTTIAFGACCHQDREQPIWDAIVAAEPDLFIFAGDNVYGDTEDMAVLQSKYDQLAAVPGYQRLRAACPILAVYDDHDYGQNDGGREYPMRAQSAAMCLDVFGVPEDDPRRQHEGIYGASMMGDPGRRVQIILLDTRYFRDPIDRGMLSAKERLEANVVGWYTPTQDTTRTLLGEAQWKWLAGELRKEAQVRLIVSSIQVVPSEKGMECWGNMPHERDSLFGLIESTDANGVVFLSGDVHFAEISRSGEGPYPLYDFTSSGLAQAPHETWPAAVNSYRLPDMLHVGENFGLVQIDWNGADTQLRLQARTVDGELAFEQTVELNRLRKTR